MAWDEENQAYVSPQGIDTSNRLGKIEFEYDMQLNVFGVGNIRFSQTAEKNIGHRITVIPSATHRITGASIQEGEAVSANTDFQFDVKLANKTHSNIKSGDFDVSFAVMDSSYTIIEREIVPARSNDELFNFQYTLEKLNIPAGDLTFLVSVINEEGRPYANELVTYAVNVPMIVSDVQFTTSELSLGGQFSASVVPATFPELREILTLAPADSESSNARKFYLDISTTSGAVVNSLLGQADANGRYSFEYTVPHSYGSLGNFVVSFRYETSNGANIELEIVRGGEISEEPLNFSVNAKLQAEILEQPSSTNFYYGNDVTYRLRVSDSLTGSSVSVGSQGGVFLNVYHSSENDKSFLSTKLPAEQEGDVLVINWKVNPNAVSGAGRLVLVAEGPGGDEIPLLVAGKQFTSNVNIGGEIKEDVLTFSTDDFYSSQTAFIVQFELSCNNVLLHDVKLRAIVFYEGEEIGSTPVGVSGDKYLASWNSLHLEAQSGTYAVKFYREADQQRASDNEEWKQRQLRDKQREAELSGEKFDEAKFLASLESVEVEPLFSVSLPHRVSFFYNFQLVNYSYTDFFFIIISKYQEVDYLLELNGLSLFLLLLVSFSSIPLREDMQENSNNLCNQIYPINKFISHSSIVKLSFFNFFLRYFYFVFVHSCANPSICWFFLIWIWII